MKDESEYGRDRLRKFLKTQCTQSPQQVVQGIFEDIDAFRGVTPLTDDQTLIAMKVL